MSHPAAAIPILSAASALGLKIEGRKTSCFNGVAHKSGIDAKPSLTFSPEKNRFRCYACDVRGDPIDLVRGFRDCSFAEAIVFLEGLNGGFASTGTDPIPVGFGTKIREPGSCEREIYTALYTSCIELTPTLLCGQYLKNRGIDLDLANQLGVRETGDGWVWPSLKSRFGEDALKRAGLLTRGGQFLFAKHPLLFFYLDGGAPVYVVARDITGDARAKELSLPGLFCSVPYLRDVLRSNPDRILICEGHIDALSATQLNYMSVGVPGVTRFQDEWFDLFRGVGSVIIAFDNDTAGRTQSAELRSRFRLRGIRADSGFPIHGNDMNDLLMCSSTEAGQ